MSPKDFISTGVLSEADEEVQVNAIPNKVFETDDKHMGWVWEYVAITIYYILSSIIGLYLAFTSAKFYSIFWFLFLDRLQILAITAGHHRLWSHKSYKAKTPLKVFLLVISALAGQTSAINWAKKHRVHHKFSDTDADPHNIKRGLFFAQFGWVLTQTHPEVYEKEKCIDMTDLTSDPWLAHQDKYYWVGWFALFCYVIPISVPMYFWGETFVNAWHLNLLRYFVGLQCTGLVNSFAHMFGNKPYDKFIKPTESSLISIVTLGEGWHNYHHTFPWDYKAAELGKFSTNFTAPFIELMAKIGQAYDLKSVSDEMVQKRVKRTGDGTHEVWGWGDKDQPEEERNEAIITYKKDA